MLTRNYDVEKRLKVVDHRSIWSRDVWSQLAEMGILDSVSDPDEAGQIELTVVLTEIGRRLAPEPVAAAALIPGGVIAELGDDAQRKTLDDVAEGKTLLAWLITNRACGVSRCGSGLGLSGKAIRGR